MTDQNGDDGVSLDPLTPEEALRALLAVKPDDEQTGVHNEPEQAVPNDEADS